MATEPAYQITKDLWQGAMNPVARYWPSYETHIDALVVMAPWVELIPAKVAYYYPIDDNDQGLPDVEFDRLSEFLRTIPREHRRIMTICHMGENRSGLASVLRLIHNGVGTDDAIDLVRSTVKPRSGQPHVFWNPGFVAQVRRLFPYGVR